MEHLGEKLTYVLIVDDRHQDPMMARSYPGRRDGPVNTVQPVRNLAVDFYRVTGVVLIVLGHWLAGSVTYRDGYFGRQNPLVDQP